MTVQLCAVSMLCVCMYVCLCVVCAHHSVHSGPQSFLICTGTLAGMCESQGKIPSSTSDKRSIEETVLSVANLGPVRGEATGSILRFAGVTFASQSVVLVTVESKEGNASITVNCEKMTIHSILLKELKEALAQI